MSTTTYEEVRERVTAFFNEHEKDFCYLYERWQDEQKYEDWNDYIAAMKKTIEGHGGTFLSASKRPFSVFFQMDGLNVEIHVTSRNVHLYVRR